MQEKPLEIDDENCIYSGDEFIASCGSLGDFDHNHENARRIVACLNACAGLSTERLESGNFNTLDLIDAAFRASEAHVETARQRNRLRDVVRLAVNINPYGSVENAKVRDMAIAALAEFDLVQKLSPPRVFVTEYIREVPGYAELVRRPVSEWPEWADSLRNQLLRKD